MDCFTIARLLLLSIFYVHKNGSRSSICLPIIQLVRRLAVESNVMYIQCIITYPEMQCISKSHVKLHNGIEIKRCIKETEKALSSRVISWERSWVCVCLCLRPSHHSGTDRMWYQMIKYFPFSINPWAALLTSCFKHFDL